jgi:hypothetical protein
VLANKYSPELIEYRPVLLPFLLILNWNVDPEGMLKLAVIDSMLTLAGG